MTKSKSCGIIVSNRSAVQNESTTGYHTKYDIHEEPPNKGGHPMKLPYINTITQQELCAHIEDDDFFLRFGNPVAIRTDDGTVLLCIAIEYYERMTDEKIEIQED